MIIVPLLVLYLGVDIHYAIGTSLIAVIATSTASSSAFVKEGYSNVRVALFLETATTIGAVSGVLIATHLPVSLISILFGLILLYSGFSSFFSNDKIPKTSLSAETPHLLNLDSDYPHKGKYIHYHVQHIPWGYFIMYIAGALSGILGIGSGALKVIALDKIMKLPFKVSTTTSNFMIGVTAATSAGLYLRSGYIDPILTMPVVIGIMIGAFFGASLLKYVHTKILRYIFGILIIGISIQMILKGLG